MENATMVYRPGSELIHGFMVDYQVIDELDVNDALADGWYLTPTEAGEADQKARDAVAAAEIEKAKAAVQKADEAPPTRDELEAKAKELGVKFDGRTTDKKLGDLIADKLKG